MADNPITTPLPADLPEQWTYGQTVGPNGTDVGLTQQHGYNYLMQQVNATQEGVNALGEAMEDLPDLEYLKNYESLYPVTQLAADTDLDTVTTPGVYYATLADISTILNKPPNFAGYLVLVVRRGIYTTMLHQEIYNWSSATTFSKFWRSKTSSADSWTEWIEEFTPVVDYHATSLDPDIDTITDNLIMVASSHSKSCPVSGSWILIQQFFFQSVSVTSRRIQIAYGFPSASSTTNASGMAIRRYSESDNTWSAWEKIYTSRQKPTAEDVGALPISGGTMTGPLTLSGDPAEDLQAAPKQYVDNAAAAVLPSGCILLWSGAKDAIPDGFVLCDGQNNTPDLRSKFVLGAGSTYAVGATGGEAAHTLTVNEIPSHTHDIYHGGFSSDPTHNSVRSGYIGENNSVAESGVITNTGGGQPHNNMPPYYALCYIMKV